MNTRRRKRTTHHHQERGGEEEEEGEEREDGISQLPDAILHHILSLMPLKSAARTSVLSNRWRGIWYSMWAHATCFDFGGKYSTGMQLPQLVAAINRFLRLHRGNTIEKFHLFVYPGVHYRSDIRRWIRFAAEKGVRELDLRFSHLDWHSFRRLRGRFKLPFPVFSCNSLSVLKLMECHFYLPENFKGFPLLKCFCLRYVTIDDYVLETMLLNCPTLEKLELQRVHFCWMKLSVRRVTLSSPGLALKSLTVSDFSESVDEIEIDAPGLLFFHLCDYFCHRRFLFGNLSSVEEAIIDLFSFSEDRAYVLSKFSHVKILTICGDTVLNYSRKLSNEVHRGLPVVYPNLIELQLTIKLLDEDHLNAIYVLFKQCRFPTLEKLFIEFLQYEKEVTILPTGKEPAECVFTHLKAVKITCFHGWNTEMQLVKFLLERAVVLESLVLIAVEIGYKLNFPNGAPASLAESSEELLSNALLLTLARERLPLLPKASSNAHVVLFEQCWKDDRSFHPTHTGQWSAKSLPD